MPSTPSPNMPCTSTAAALRQQTPAQDQLSQKIALEQKKLSIMRQQFESGLGNVTKKDITAAEGEITKLEKMLSRKISCSNASQKLRTKCKAEMNELIEKDHAIAKKLKIRETVGRPRLEDDQSDLLQTIKTLAMFGGAAEDRRCLEAI